MDRDMTPDEVRAIRWVEHVLAPLMVVGIITLSTCAMQTQEAVAELQATNTTSEKMTAKTEVAIKEVKQNQAQLLRQQHDIEVNVQRIEVHQEHFKREINDLKDQNARIIQILTSGGNNNGNH